MNEGCCCRTKDCVSINHRFYLRYYLVSSSPAARRWTCMALLLIAFVAYDCPRVCVRPRNRAIIQLRPPATDEKHREPTDRAGAPVPTPIGSPQAPGPVSGACRPDAASDARPGRPRRGNAPEAGAPPAATDRLTGAGPARSKTTRNGGGRRSPRVLADSGAALPGRGGGRQERNRTGHRRAALRSRPAGPRLPSGPGPERPAPVPTS